MIVNKEYDMKPEQKLIDVYTNYKNSGMSPEQIFNQAKIDGYKNFECIHLLMVVFDISLDEARTISHRYYLKK
jgi:hypothetical protein